MKLVQILLLRTNDNTIVQTKRRLNSNRLLRPAQCLTCTKWDQIMAVKITMHSPCQPSKEKSEAQHEHKTLNTMQIANRSIISRSSAEFKRTFRKELVKCKCIKQSGSSIWWGDSDQNFNCRRHKFNGAWRLAGGGSSCPRPWHKNYHTKSWANQV